MLFETLIVCIAMTSYLEAWGEPVIGEIAVAQVIVWRVGDPRYPDNACDVSRQSAQFASANVEYNEAAWERSLRIASGMFRYHVDVTDGSTHFYSKAPPYWAGHPSMTPTVRIGRHQFMRRN